LSRRAPGDAEDPAVAYLAQSALALAKLCRKSFGITGKSDGLKIEKEIRATDVSAFLTEYTARIRPIGLSSAKTFPTPSPTHLRTFLWSRPMADAVLNDVVRLSLYSDEIVIVDPFSYHTTNNPGFRPAPLGPFVRPELWTQEFANQALMVCALEGWIEHRLAILIPEPKNFVKGVPSFMEMAKQAIAEGRLSTVPGPDFLQDVLEAAALNAVQDDEVPHLVADILPPLSLDDLQTIIDSLKAYRRANPTRYAPPLRGIEGQVSGMASGQNLFEAAWIADQLGGYVVPRLAKDRTSFRRFSRGDSAKDSIDALGAAFAAAPLPMLNNVSLSDALDLRRSGRLASFRSFLQEVWTTTSDPDMDTKTVERERHLIDALNARYGEAKDEWRGIYKDLGVHGAVALFTTTGLATVIESGVVPIVGTALGWLHKQWSGPTRAFRRRPAGLLVQLENQSSPNPVRRAIDAIERRL